MSRAATVLRRRIPSISLEINDDTRPALHACLSGLACLLLFGGLCALLLTH